MKKNILIQANAGLILLFAILTINTSQAQINNAERHHIGVAVSFGNKATKISSDLAHIHQLNLLQEGGSVGLLWGNKAMETKLALGFYYSASRVDHTIDLINVESSVNFYPLSALTGRKHKLEPYFTSGLSANNYKFYGFYTAAEPGKPNYSVSEEPYLGSVATYYGSVGTGLEFNLLRQNDFVKIFTEVNYSSPLIQKSSDPFKNTHLSNQLCVSLGLSVGLTSF